MTQLNPIIIPPTVAQALKPAPPQRVLKMDPHSRQQGWDCIDRAKEKWGPGAWRMLSDSQREHAICAEIVSVLLAQPIANPDSLQHAQNVARAALHPEPKHEWRSNP